MCVFCKIVSGDIPCSKVYEDDSVLCFLDINPVEKGHTLVVPKRHSATLMDAPPDDLPKVILAVQKIANALMACGADGVNVCQNNNTAAGQLVPHLHFHVIPRKTQDAPRKWASGSASYLSAEERDDTAAKIRENV